MEVELVDGKRGELTFLVDGRVVAKKGLFFKPSVPKVLQAVRAANNANPNGGAPNGLATRVSIPCRLRSSLRRARDRGANVSSRVEGWRGVL